MQLRSGRSESKGTDKGRGFFLMLVIHDLV